MWTQYGWSYLFSSKIPTILCPQRFLIIHMYICIFCDFQKLYSFIYWIFNSLRKILRSPLSLISVSGVVNRTHHYTVVLWIGHNILQWCCESDTPLYSCVVNRTQHSRVVLWIGHTTLQEAGDISSKTNTWPISNTEW